MDTFTQPQPSNPQVFTPSQTFTVTTPPQQTYQQAVPDTPKPKSKLKKMLLIIGALFLLGVAGFGYLIFQGVKDAPQVKAKITSFMQEVSNNNLDSAYLLTSSEFKNATSKEDFARAMNVFRAQYTGFKDQEQTGFSVEANAGQPTQYKYSGVINYADGDKGEVTAILIKEDGEWKIFGIEVNVDVKRMEKFQQQNKDSVLGASTSR